MPHWWPKVMRWSAEGGEVYLLRPSNLNAPYHVKFDAVVGLELKKDARIIELWANGIKFDEFELISSARYISKPFIPKEKVVKLVVKIRERVKPMRRPLPIWNEEIPVDYRQLNVAFSKISVLPKQNIQNNSECDQNLDKDEIFECALTFNGIQVDRWIGKEADLEIGNNKVSKISEMNIKGFIPGNLGFKFPFKIEFNINENTVIKKIDKPGNFSLNFPLSKTKLSEKIKIGIKPSQVHNLKGQLKLRRKLVKQAFRLDSIIIN